MAQDCQKKGCKHPSHWHRQTSTAKKAAQVCGKSRPQASFSLSGVQHRHLQIRETSDSAKMQGWSRETLLGDFFFSAGEATEVIQHWHLQTSTAENDGAKSLSWGSKHLSDFLL
jgi:hypothetical protein